MHICRVDAAAGTLALVKNNGATVASAASLGYTQKCDHGHFGFPKSFDDPVKKRRLHYGSASAECSQLISPSSWIVNGRPAGVRRPFNCRFASEQQLGALEDSVRALKARQLWLKVGANCWQGPHQLGDERREPKEW